MMKMQTKNLFIALFFSLTLTVFGPLHIYFTNLSEFDSNFLNVVLVLIPVCLLLTGLIFGILTLLKGKIQEKTTSIVFIISFLFWFQGNVLLWNYGILNGQEIDWASRWYLGLIDGLVWLIFIIVAIIRSSWVISAASKLSKAFILIQLLSVSYFGYANRSNYSFKSYVIDDTNKFTFSSKQNVIIFLLDAFQSDIFQEIIDENGYGKKMFDGFIYFRNAVTPFPSTYPAIPLILTGQTYDNSIPIQDFIKKAYLSDTSLPMLLKRNQFQVDLFPWIKQAVYYDKRVFSNFMEGQRKNWNHHDVLRMFDVSLFKHLPHFLKKSVYNNQSWFLSSMFPETFPVNLDTMVNDMDNRNDGNDVKSHIFSEDALNKLQDLRFMDNMLRSSKVDDQYGSIFKYYHLLGIHAPLTMNEYLEFEQLETTRANYLKCARGNFRLLQLYLEKLKKMGIYDNSLLLVIGDHGGYTTVQYNERIKAKNSLISKNSEYYLPPRKSLALPLILVKPIGHNGPLETRDAPVSLLDIPKTILSELDIQHDQMPGFSMFDIEESFHRERSFFSFLPSVWDNQYLNVMSEYHVNGFSWFDESWTKSGREFQPGERLKHFYEKLRSSNEYLGQPRLYTQSKDVYPVYFQLIEGWWENAQNSFQWHFPNHNPQKGEYIGLSVPIKRLEKDIEYRIQFEILDPYDKEYPERFEQMVYLDGKEIYKHDLAGDLYMGWKLIEYEFTSASKHVEFKIELQTVGNPEIGWKWGDCAKIGIRNIEIQKIDE